VSAAADIRTADRGADPVYLSPHAQAGALAGALEQRGFTAAKLTSHAKGGHPCVKVDSGPGRIVTAPGLVYAGPGDDGVWWFWLASQSDPLDLEPIALLSDISVTADAIDRALTRARLPLTPRRKAAPS
jgi:hypothetical protein